MHGKPLGKVGYGSFRRRICGNFGERRKCVHRRYVKYATALAPDHILCEYLRGDERAEIIEVKNKLYAALTEIEKSFYTVKNLSTGTQEQKTLL